MKLYVFYCSNSISSSQMSYFHRQVDNAELKAISLPCSGKVDIPYLVKAFETGADGVMLITCKEHECQYLEGNFRAQKRADAVTSLLDEIGIDAGRMSVLTLNEDSDEEIANSICDFCTKLENMPKLPS